MAGSPTWASAGAALLLLLEGGAEAARRPPLRFRGRLQVLSGAGFTLPADATGAQRFTAYVPLDLEAGFRVMGPVSVAIGAAGYAAPFRVAACSNETGEEGRRPHALAAFAGLRFDFNNSRDGSWLSPWISLRTGFVGQDGMPGPAPGTAAAPGCRERLVLGAFFSPRAGLDLWLGRAAVTFAVGYDVLPRASAVAAQLGLTLRLF